MNAFGIGGICVCQCEIVDLADAVLLKKIGYTLCGLVVWCVECGGEIF